jgi:hypothetical protein
VAKQRTRPAISVEIQTLDLGTQSPFRTLLTNYSETQEYADPMVLLVDETVASGIDCDAWCSGIAHDCLPLHFDRREDDGCLLATFNQAKPDGRLTTRLRGIAAPPVPLAGHVPASKFGTGVCTRRDTFRDGRSFTPLMFAQAIDSTSRRKRNDAPAAYGRMRLRLWDSKAAP